jgi:short-subunit dehydrogenase
MTSMKILILGASSQVGIALARAFAPGHELLLVGRQASRLSEAAEACKTAGAASATPVALDLTSDLLALRPHLQGGKVDLIVDAASASSALRDSEISADAFSGLVVADVLSRPRLMDLILSMQNSAPAVILISSVLARIRSQDRAVYSSLKQLQEAHLNSLRRAIPSLRLMVVYVGMVIDTQRPTDKPVQLAAAVLRGFQEGRSVLAHGTMGHLYYLLYHLQPVVFGWVTLLQRALRGRRPKQG